MRRLPFALTGLVAVAVALAAASALHANGSGAAGTSADAAPNAMAIDADPSTPSIDTSRSVTGTGAFDIGIGVTRAGAGYQGYQAELSWVDLGLDYVSSTSLMPASMILCATPSLYAAPAGMERLIGISCARTSGTTTFTGPTDLATLQCHGDGTFVIHFVMIDEDSSFGTTTLDATAHNIATDTADATVTCLDTGFIIPTATETLTPTVTPTPSATSTNTKTATAVVPSQTVTPAPVFTRTPTPSPTPLLATTPAPGLTATPSATPSSTATPSCATPPCADVIGVDADPSTAAIDSTRTISGDGPFAIGVDITQAPVAYQGYRVQLRWPEGSANFVGSAPDSPAGLISCGGAALRAIDPQIVLSDVCSRAPFTGGTNFVGLLETITLRCAANGTFTIHATSLSEDSFGGTAALQGDFFPQSAIPTDTFDATITCADAPSCSSHIGC